MAAVRPTSGQQSSSSSVPRLTTTAPSPGATTPHPHHRPSADNVLARVLGILVFLAGVALLVYVFQVADSLFRQAPPKVPATAALQAAGGNAAAAPSAAMQIGQSLTDYLKKLLTLLLMCLAGSLVASKGIHLYFSAGRAHAAHTAAASGAASAAASGHTP